MVRRGSTVRVRQRASQVEPKVGPTGATRQPLGESIGEYARNARRSAPRSLGTLALHGLFGTRVVAAVPSAHFEGESSRALRVLARRSHARATSGNAESFREDEP